MKPIGVGHSVLRRMNSLPAMKSSVPRLNKFPASCTGNLPQALEAAAPIRTRIARLAHDPQKFAAIFPAPHGFEDQARYDSNFGNVALAAGMSVSLPTPAR